MSSGICGLNGSGKGCCRVSVLRSGGGNGSLRWSVAQQFARAAEQRPQIRGDSPSTRIYLLQIRKGKKNPEKCCTYQEWRSAACQAVAIVTVGYFVEAEGGNAAGGGGGGGGYIYEMEVTWW